MHALSGIFWKDAGGCDHDKTSKYGAGKARGKPILTGGLAPTQYPLAHFWPMGHMAGVFPNGLAFLPHFLPPPPAAALHFKVKALAPGIAISCWPIRCFWQVFIAGTQILAHAAEQPPSVQPPCTPGKTVS